MRIAHLSDIHLSKDNLSSLKQFYLAALLKDLNNWNSEKRIDLVVLTGDLVDKGGTSFPKEENPYDTIEREFILPIVNSLGLSINHFIIIPGNHDIEESKIEDLIESGMVDKFDNIERVNKYVAENKNFFHSGITRIQRYIEFHMNLYKGVPDCYMSNFESCFIVDLLDEKIGIAAFNSAWRSSPKLVPNKLMFGTQQVLDANDFFTANGVTFKIALIHHPLELIGEVDRNELTSFLHTNNFHILLCGHTHKGENVYSFGTRNKLFTSVAKTAFNNPREKTDIYKPGYSILDFDKTITGDVEITCSFRKYIHSRVEFDKDVDSCPDGECKENLKISSNGEDFNKYLLLTDKTCRAKQELINTSLVVYGTDSIAPRTINELFVLPKLTEKPTLSDIDDDMAFIHIHDLLSTNKKILIIGDKETGKTILLNKIFIEASNTFTTYQVVPIEIDFSELKKKDIKPIIRGFLNDPSHEEIEQMLQDGKFLLLIDNYIDNDENVHAVNRLKRFIDEYSLNKIILTTATDIETLLTSENTIFSKKSLEESIKEFKPIFIGSVGVKEFKELAIKWFRRKDSQWIQNNLEKLIKVFEILRIPRTFFSVSLFLWIIEKQENFKPINKANLIQQFLLFILEGLKIDNAKAGSYNFEKKIELLTELALQMHNYGEKSKNLSLPETEAIACIQKNFDLNQLRRFSATDKLTEFVEKGILRKEFSDNTIRFRFEAFFKYFLSLNIEKDTEFRKEVFSDEKFLSFIDELDYHTGRKRDDKDTLEFSMKKLQEAYVDIDGFINQNVDNYFPNESFILKHINPTNFISEVRSNKLSDEEVEEALGNQLELLPVDDSIKAKKKVDYRKKFYSVLELAARVLKNSENIKNPEYINESLDLIVNRAAKYGIYLQSIIAHNLAKNTEEELPFPPEFFIIIAPIINQLMLLSWLGTDFLETPIELKIKRYLNQGKKDLSQYELYLTAFIYSDMKLKDYIQIIDKVIVKVDNKFIVELCFLKVFLYYMFRPMNSSLLPTLENQLARLLVKSRGITKKKAKNFVEEVLRKKKEEAMAQLKIEL